MDQMNRKIDSEINVRRSHKIERPDRFTLRLKFGSKGDLQLILIAVDVLISNLLKELIF